MKMLVDALDRRLNIERARRTEAERQLQIKADELQRKNEELGALASHQEELIALRTAELEAARDAAIAGSQAKSAFLANMSHEIRTPLTSIIGFGELLLEHEASSVDKEDAVRTIIRNGRHLLEVINDILDLAKIETNQMDLEQIDLPMPVLLRDVSALVTGRASERGLEFVVQPHLPLPATIRTDPLRLKQILLNLCSNAVKFTAEGSVTLELYYLPETQSMRFTVADTGIGMSADQQARLFQPFAQADVSTTRKFGGTGLGLYLSRQFADRLGGCIGVESQPGRGSRFTLELRLPAAPRAADMLTMEGDLIDYGRADFAITGTTVPDLRGRVLLAEDGPDNQRLLSAYLKQAGLWVTVARNGREAIDLALDNDVDLVLMDIQMPVIDGVTATTTLRAAGFTAPIVALTANVMKDDVQRYRAAGCNGVLAKPVDRARFYAMIARHIAGSAGPAESAEPDDRAYREEMAALAAEFRAGLPAQIDAMRLALQRDDWPRLRALIHTLKGTAGSFGYGRLGELAAGVDAELAAARHGRAGVLCEGLLLEGHKALSSIGPR